MPKFKFKVQVARVQTHYRTLEVEASTPEAAKVVAECEMDLVQWDLDDDSGDCEINAIHCEKVE